MSRRTMTSGQRKAKHRSGWNVYRSAPDDTSDRTVYTQLAEDQARAVARALNLALLRDSGRPPRLPCEFYYAQHGNNHESERDAGLNQWIDEGRPEADREDAA